MRYDPNTTGTPGTATEERFIIVTGGSIGISVDGTSHPLETGDILYVPAGSRYGYESGGEGCFTIEALGKPNPEYSRLLADRMRKFHEVIPEDTVAEVFVDGLHGDAPIGGPEGPSWLNGELYFSDQGGFGFHKVDRHGRHTLLKKEYMSVGTTPLGNGNLAVCEITVPFGAGEPPRGTIVEMTPDGDIVRTIAEKYDGNYVGIPNDLITDTRGGIYFTDPWGGRFPDRQKGSAVYYVRPGGDVIRVTEWDDVTFPNGCMMSPDGSTFFLGSNEKTIWMYDVAGDGGLSNKRPFCEVIIGDAEFAKETPKSFTDGIALDRDGNLYVVTRSGIQIFDTTGEYVGHIHIPHSNFHCVFGGADLSTLYVLAIGHVYSIQTNSPGFQYPIE